jgi:hypothetical protein
MSLALWARPASALETFSFDDVADLTNAAAESLLKTVSIGADHHAYQPASPLGFKPGFDLGVDVTAIQLPAEFRSAMTQLGNSDVPQFLPLPRLNIHKGLPFNIDLGFSWVAYQGNKIVGIEAQWAFLPGHKGMPAVAFRASQSYSDLFFLRTRTTAFDLVGSKKLGPIFEPYVGFGWQIGGGELNVPLEDLPITVEASQTFNSGRVFAGFPIKLLVLRISPEYTYSFTKVSTFGLKVSLGL